MPIFAGCTEAPKPRVALQRHVDVNFNFSDLSHYRNTNRKLLRGCPSVKSRRCGLQRALFSRKYLQRQLEFLLNISYHILTTHSMEAHGYRIVHLTTHERLKSDYLRGLFFPFFSALADACDFLCDPSGCVFFCETVSIYTSASATYSPSPALATAAQNLG